MDIRLSVDAKDVLQSLDMRRQQKAFINATNYLLSKARAEARRQIKSKYNLQLKSIYIKTKRAVNNTIGYLMASKAWLSLWRFKAKQGAAGVTVQVVRGQTITIDGTFLALPIGKSYKKQGQRRTVKRRNPLVLRRAGYRPYILERDEKDYSKSVGDMLMDQDVLNNVQQYIGDREFQALKSSLIREIWKK
jgi:hypothetical protein